MIWADHPPSPNVQRFAMPYVRAVLELQTCHDKYGLEYGDMIVAYLVSNMSNWRGPEARRLKDELNAHLKEFNRANHNS